MRYFSPLVLAAVVLGVVAPLSSASAYADRRTFQFGERNRVITRYEVNRAILLEDATPTYHCVYMMANGRCQAVAKTYTNVSSPRIISRERYLDVTPTTVSPRAPERYPLYVRPSSYYYYEEYVPAYDRHYRRTHSFDDGVRYEW